MEITKNVSLHNEFTIIKRDIRTNKTEQVGKAYNIIVDQMWERLCNEDSYFNNIAFGTGSGTLSTSRTGLFNYLDDKSAETTEEVWDYPVSKWQRKVILAPEEYVGEEISEVGVAYSSGTGNLVTHALVEDSEGNPITIPKTEFDEITIYADVYITLDDNMYDGQVKFFPSATNNRLVQFLFQNQSSLFGQYRVGYGDTFGSTWFATGSTASRTADVGNRKILFSEERFGTADGNSDYGIWNVGFASDTDEIIFTSVLPVTGVFEGYNVEGEEVGVGDGTTTEFDLKWEKGSNLTLKVDGSPVSEDNYEFNFRKEYIINKQLPPDGLPGHGHGVTFTSDDKYMAVAHRNGDYITVYDLFLDGADHHIIFDTAPTDGAVITADYEIPFIPKDENHVLDVSFSIQFSDGGE